MPFLNPVMLFALSAVSVPIIIHLLNRRKFDRVIWAAMRFVRISVEQNQRRIRIEDLLLLLLRCLLLALLALALARPVMRAAAAAFLGPAKVTAVIVLDNSYSMSQTDGVTSRFSQGKQAAGEVLKGLPVGSSVAVFLASDTVSKLIASPTYDLTLADRQIQDAPIHDRATNLLPGIKAAMDALGAEAAARKEVFVITDGQSLGWRQMDQIKQLIADNRKEIRTHLVFVGEPEERNLGITQVRLDTALVPVNVPVRLEARVKNFGRSEVSDVNVRIAVNEDPPMDQATISMIPAGEERSISLFARLRSAGYHTITARIDSDHLPADDARTLALRAVKDVKVLLIDGDSGREARESEMFYLRAALRPVPRAEWEDYHIKVTTKVPTDLDMVRFEDFDAVMAGNVTDFGAGTLAQLVNYVKGGGSVLFFPGDNINATFWNEQLYTRYMLLPSPIGPARGDARDQEKWFSLLDRNLEHEIVALWKDAAAGSLASAKFFKAVDLTDQDARRRGDEATKGDAASAGPARVVARFSDNRPALMERNYGQGRVLLFASTADTAWNDLGARAGIWVPLIHRTLGYMIARQDEHLTIRVGQSFVHTAPIELMGKDVLIRKAARSYGGREKDDLEESRSVEMVNNAPTLQFDDALFAGAYTVTIGDSAPIRFAVQSDPEESSLAALTAEQVNDLKDIAHVVQWQSGGSIREELERGRVGTELWMPLAMIALALATMETLLAHWFSKPK